jgi:hypothetical protein
MGFKKDGRAVSLGIVATPKPEQKPDETKKEVVETVKVEEHK